MGSFEDAYKRLQNNEELRQKAADRFVTQLQRTQREQGITSAASSGNTAEQKKEIANSWLNLQPASTPRSEGSFAAAYKRLQENKTLKDEALKRFATEFTKKRTSSTDPEQIAIESRLTESAFRANTAKTQDEYDSAVADYDRAKADMTSWHDRNVQTAQI